MRSDSDNFMSSNEGTRDIIPLLARSAFGEIRCSGESYTLVVEEEPGQVRIAYFSGRACAGSGAPAFVHLRFHLDTGEMWISSLRVASSYRRCGVGRQLVRAAERLASLLDGSTIHVFPLAGARFFWKKMGYEPHQFTARVLSKPSSSSQERDRSTTSRTLARATRVRSHEYSAA